MESKTICRYLESGYCIFVPVYYEIESRPAWRVVFTGTRKECEKVFCNYPDFLRATAEENKKHRENKIKELIFLESIKKYKEAEEIRKQLKGVYNGKF